MVSASPALILVVFMITNFLNFVLVAIHLKAFKRLSFVGSLRTCISQCCRSEFATALLTAGLAFSYSRIGIGVVGLAAVVLFVFQYLLALRRRGVRARRGA